MNQTVTLVHMTHKIPVRAEYFYDGNAVAHDGVLSLPADNLNWIKAAYLRGYQKDSEGTQILPGMLTAYIEKQTAKSAEGNIHEGNDTGGQSSDNDRVRTGQRKSRQKTPK